MNYLKLYSESLDLLERLILLYESGNCDKQRVDKLIDKAQARAERRGYKAMDSR
jgi:hypothetical protein